MVHRFGEGREGGILVGPDVEGVVQGLDVHGVALGHLLMHGGSIRGVVVRHGRGRLGLGGGGQSESGDERQG
jgi:hypothetical protein